MHINFSNVISLVAFSMAAFTFWYCYLRRGEAQGCFSYIEIPIGYVTASKVGISPIFKPYFFLKNIGAKSIILEGIKLKFSYNGSSFYASPECVIGGGESNNFTGIVLSPDEDWSNSLRFKIQQGHQFKDIAEHQCTITIEIKPFRRNKWIEIKTNCAKFRFEQDELVSERLNPIYKFFLTSVKN